MKSIVPYTKDIKFNSKIAEICSLSLEHEFSPKENELSGVFIISGEYKSHEVSVNKEPFEFKLPFSMEVTERVKKDSIDFEITDFTYEVIDDETLRVNIELSVYAEEEKEEKVEEIIEEEKEEEEENPVREKVMEEIENLFPTLEEPVERIEKDSEEMILNTIKDEEEKEFAKYHIHIVAQTDSIESICTLYNIDLNTLKEYNTIDSINIGDKIIIPEFDE